MLRLLLSAGLFVAVILPVLLGIGAPAARSSPEFYLWAWQRNEDLSFIDPDTTKVALWVGTITVADANIDVTPRQNPVVYPVNTELLGVVRLEVDGAYDAEFAQQLAQMIQSLVVPLATREIQIDFDARVSQRDLYRELLHALRTRLPEKRLSITALASWCLGDPWLTTLPIDAAVPMLYRMSIDGPRVRQYLSEQGHFPAIICRDNIGYSSDEPVVAVGDARRVFWYHPAAWSAEALMRAQALAAAMTEPH